MTSASTGSRSQGRRAVSVPGLGVLAVGLVVTAPVWIPVTLLVDLVTAPRRLPRLRMMAFAVMWAWIELAGVAVAGLLWATGRSTRLRPHVRLQHWWARRVSRALEQTVGLRVVVDHPELLHPGPIVVLARHASLADSLVSARLLLDEGFVPRYVLKRELALDPCLDIVGHRLPNHFLDRSASDSGPELAALTALATGMGPEDATVIFPEGTRANDAKRARGLARIAERDPARAERLSALRRLMPVRLAGTRAILAGAPTADVVMLGHVGFEGLDSFGGALRRVPLRHPVEVTVRRISREQVPSDPDALVGWLDGHWLDLDTWVDARLGHRASATGSAASGSSPTGSRR